MSSYKYKEAEKPQRKRFRTIEQATEFAKEVNLVAKQIQALNTETNKSYPLMAVCEENERKYNRKTTVNQLRW